MKFWFISFLLLSSTLHARWATLEDSAGISLIDNSTITVKANGTFTSLREKLIEIRNEEGRTSVGNSSIRYNSRTSKVKILQAETRVGRERIPVQSEYIEDKPLASSAEGFDETRQVSIAFPRIEIGSQVYLKYEETVSEVPFDNFFSEEFTFGPDILEKTATVRIRSELPLFVEKNDPRGVLKVKTIASKPGTEVYVELRKPIFAKIVDEEDSVLNPLDQTTVVISSEKAYAALAKRAVDRYEAILNAPLPAPLEKIYQKAKGQKTFVDRANAITSALADQVRYLGDWRPTHGGHIPRPLHTIFATKFGDCKDLAASTVAVLRKLGYQAHVAWVERNVKPSPLPKIVLDTAFNHAIVHAKDGTETHWVDPTNYASFAQGIFEDIIGREALVVDPKGPHLAQIPAGVPEGSVSEKFQVLTFEPSGDVLVNATLQYRGRNATSVTGITRELSKDSINHLIAKTIAEENVIKWSKVGSYDLSSRITKDITLKAEVAMRRFALQTTAGQAHVLSRAGLGRVIELEPDKRESDLFLGVPETNRLSYRLKNLKPVGELPKGCSLDTPWLQVVRTVSSDKEGILVEDLLKVKTLAIRITDIKSPAFRKFQTALQDCFQQVAIVFKR